MPIKHTVLVTGANGLLGSNIVSQLITKGYNVRAIVRKGSNRNALKDLNCEITEGNITNIFDLETALEGCSFVIHSAARTRQFPNNWKLYRQANINSTALLIESCKKHNIKRFIYVSTANCFSNGTLENPGTEESGFMSWLKRSGYAYSKYIAQQMVLEEAMQNNFPAIVVAPTFMIGARDAKPSSGKLLIYGLKNRIIFYPPGGKSFIDVEHAAEATVNALQKGKIGECYLLSGANLSYRDFFVELKKYHKKNQLLIPIPIYCLKMVAYFFSLMEFIFRISLPLNLTNLRLLCLDNYFNNNKARSELELKTTSIHSSIEKAKHWFKMNKYL